MGSLDFHVDFNIEVENISDQFNIEAEQALRELAAHHSDLTGASVSLENIVKTESPYLYQVRIVLYKRPEDIAVVEKGVEPMVALKGAIDALKGKVRDSREKLAQRESRRAGTHDAVIQELTPEEVYATFFGKQDSSKFLDKDRTELASKLMVEEGLEQEAAYFAADQILLVAQEDANK
jgi:hypothetical protein